MKNTTLKKLSFLLVSALLLTNLVSAQHLTFEVPLNEQVQVSTQIVEGKVLSKASFYDANQQNIYTVNTVEVYKVFKGQSVSTIEVITSGGTVGLNAEVVTPSLGLSVGNIGVFLLQDSNINLTSVTSNPRFKSNSSVQGFYKYNIQDNIAVNPYGVINGITSVFYPEIMSLTNTGMVNLSSFDVNEELNRISNMRGGIAINDFSPTTITAGTKSVLTINGGGFGSPGTVQFRDANDGGSTFYTALDSQIISWTPTQIQVEVPDRAGTGTFRVFDNIGFNVTSSTPLNISYAQINVETDAFTPGVETAYQTQHIDTNGSDGYTWQMELSFSLDADANASFTRAFETWVCETGVNWIIGSFTTTDVVAGDGINIIRFDNGAELPGGVLGRNTSRFSGCGTGGGQWFVTELDINFNDTTNWEFGPALPSGGEFDFETVAVHELGHGHQLAHVIDTGAIMHFQTSGGANRVLSVNDIDGGNDVQSRSTTSSVCGQGLMTDSSCSLSVDDNFLADNLSIFPIPTKDNLYIKSTSNINLENAIIYDLKGQFIAEIDLKEFSALHTIDTTQLASGMYFINVNTDNASITRKFIIE